ncbi:hypothetical protein TRVL_06859 [Trypanosoma vivax]|nr:hypothetical protein TRVL_06859 [Trypanosoma vivax]
MHRSAEAALFVVASLTACSALCVSLTATPPFPSSPAFTHKPSAIFDSPVPIVITSAAILMSSMSVSFGMFSSAISQSRTTFSPKSSLCAFFSASFADRHSQSGCSAWRRAFAFHTRQSQDVPLGTLLE